MAEAANHSAPASSKSNLFFVVCLFGLGFLSFYLFAEKKYSDEKYDYAPPPAVPIRRPAPIVWSPSLVKEHGQVLLVTKGRSGSTFTSALVSSNPDVFFSYEPLYAENQRLRNSKDIEFLRDPVVEIVRSYLICDFMNLTTAKHLFTGFTKKATAGSEFTRCEQDKQATAISHIQCLINWVKLCRKKQMSFSKLIRFPMRWAEDLMEQQPGLKILYLIRDPRAVIYSQSKNLPAFRRKWPEGLRELPAQHCREIAEDLHVITRLSVIYPGRIRIIRFEDGAIDPYRYAVDIYNFLGMKFSSETKSLISTMQSPRQGSPGKHFGVREGNSSFAINTWRKVPGSIKATRIIDKLCGEAYSKLGYSKVNSPEELLSDKKELFTDYDTFTKLRETLESIV